MSKAIEAFSTSAVGRQSRRPAASSTIDHVRAAREHLEAAVASVAPVAPNDVVAAAVQVDLAAMIRALKDATGKADAAMRDALLPRFARDNSGAFRPLTGVHFRCELAEFSVARLDTKELRRVLPDVAARFMVETVEKRVSFRAR